MDYLIHHFVVPLLPLEKAWLNRFSAYKMKVPTNRLTGLWEFYVMVISPIRTSRFAFGFCFYGWK
jgi:hypothetical protein